MIVSQRTVQTPLFSLPHPMLEETSSRKSKRFVCSRLQVSTTAVSPLNFGVQWLGTAPLPIFPAPPPPPPPPQEFSLDKIGVRDPLEEESITRSVLTRVATGTRVKRWGRRNKMRALSPYIAASFRIPEPFATPPFCIGRKGGVRDDPDVPSWRRRRRVNNACDTESAAGSEDIVILFFVRFRKRALAIALSALTGGARQAGVISCFRPDR